MAKMELRHCVTDPLIYAFDVFVNHQIELWREQKLEAMRIEEELEAQRLENVQREMEWEKQKEDKKRTAEKQKVCFACLMFNL